MVFKSQVKVKLKAVELTLTECWNLKKFNKAI